MILPICEHHHHYSEIFAKTAFERDMDWEDNQTKTINMVKAHTTIMEDEEHNMKHN